MCSYFWYVMASNDVITVINHSYFYYLKHIFSEHLWPFLQQSFTQFCNEAVWKSHLTYLWLIPSLNYSKTVSELFWSHVWIIPKPSLNYFQTISNIFKTQPWRILKPSKNVYKHPKTYFSRYIWHITTAIYCNISETISETRWKLRSIYNKWSI